MHTYGNLEYRMDEIDVGGASTSFSWSRGNEATHIPMPMGRHELQ